MISTISACGKEDQLELSSEDNTASLISQFKNPIISEELISFKDKHTLSLKSSSIEQIEFNSEKLLVSSLGNSNNHALIMHEVGYDNDNIDNYSMVFLENNYQITKAFIVKEDKCINNQTKISYLSLDNKLLLEVKVDFNTNTPTIISNSGISNVKSSYGDRTVECMADVYTNHGFISLWAQVQSAYIPATAAVFAALCAVDAIELQRTTVPEKLIEERTDTRIAEKISDADFIKQMENIYNNK